MSGLEICRVCLNTGVRGCKIDQNNLKQCYLELTNIQILAKDQFPKWVCYECAALLRKFHKFREKCLHGYTVLTHLLWRGEITYASVKSLNRFSENLHSSLNIAQKNGHIKTILIKHAPKKERLKSLEVEEVIIPENIDRTDFDTEIVFPSITEEPKEPLITVDEPVLEKQDVLDNGSDIDTGIQNDADIRNDTSDDENIFLDIVKKAVSGENKLVFIDHNKKKPKKELKTTSSEVKKFTKQKRELLTPEYWEKFSLSEEEAKVEFEKLRFSDTYVKANFKCENCFKGFSKLEMLNRHIKFRHDESVGEIECRFCHMRFKQRCELVRHMMRHYNVFHCLRCDMKFTLINSATLHEEYHNGVVRKCKQCGMGFKHLSTFYTHMRMLHRSAHICSLCGASFVSEVGLTQHKKIKHFDKTDTELKTETSESTIYCEKCDLKFVSQSAYDQHLYNSNMHEELIPDVPEIKRRNLKGKRTYIVGDTVNKKFRKPTTCIHCGKHFDTQVACMKHHAAEHPRMSFYAQDQRHICEICGVSLAAVSIASHMNNHTREVIYPCEVCGMQFTSKSSHSRHQLTHTGERPYPCSLCEKRFTQKGSMKLHYRTFHLKQPYPKRNRRKKTDEVPLIESCRERSVDSDPTPARWR